MIHQKNFKNNLCKKKKRSNNIQMPRNSALFRIVPLVLFAETTCEDTQIIYGLSVTSL